MVRVEEACQIIFSNPFPVKVESVTLENAVGRIMAEPVRADRPLPPFNRVSMDGIAIQWDALQQGNRSFRVEATQAAGDPPMTLQATASCIEVMTGAALPNGTDTVIRYEDLSLKEALATITTDHVIKGQNIHRKGSDASDGEVLLESGVQISPAEIALLAAVGCPEVPVFDFPSTAIISSGNELVEVHEKPQDHEIRQSNVYALQAAMREIHWKGTRYHLRDDKEEMLYKMREVLQQHDVLILSGGVSKGKFDFVPQVLAELGVNKLFHQVNQRPGKPFWFGKTADNKFVFALPGNPVSTYMCFYRYIKPWMMKSMGCVQNEMKAVLAEDYHFSPGLTLFLQVSVRFEGGVMKAYPVAGGGSGDFANLKQVSGFLELPAEKSTFVAGELYSYFPFRSV